MMRRNLPSETNEDFRSGGDVGSGLGRLFASHAAADRIEIETGILGGFKGAAQILAQKRWDLDATFFDGENDSAV